jgi:hypothetical protein
LFTLLQKPNREVLLRNLQQKKYPALSDDIHLKAAMRWLCRAQDATGGPGVAAGYHLYRGWEPPYPETTGYIIPTFLRYAAITRETEYLHRATRMGDWECEIQMPSGAVRGITGEPYAFDTGQVIFGWSALFEQTRQQKYLNALVRAADWLGEIQEEGGFWQRYTLNQTPTTYHTRVAWALFEAHRLTENPAHKGAAEKHIAWALSHAKENGWIDHMAFQSDLHPYTHTIAYTLEGLLESSRYSAPPVQREILAELGKACSAIVACYSSVYPAYLPGTFTPAWEPGARYSCITGNAQIAIILMKLDRIQSDNSYRRAAERLIGQAKETQLVAEGNPGISGAIPGSHPIWGGYSIFNYPNWAAKFFSDALMDHLEPNGNSAAG